MSAKACNKCGGRHGPPRGRKCNVAAADTAEAASSVDATEVILAKLTAMEHRLSALEAGKSTTPSDSDDEEEELPTAENLTSLRRDATLQKQVHQRLKALGISDSDYDDEEEHKGMCPKKRAKSGRIKTASDFIKIEVEWLHYHVYRGADRKPAAYDELTAEEFIMRGARVVSAGVTSHHPSGDDQHRDSLQTLEAPLGASASHRLLRQSGLCAGATVGSEP